MNSNSEKTLRVLYGLLVEQCRQRDIARTKAFQLAKEGLLETFTIGRRRYVLIESLDSLPARLKKVQGGAP